MRIRAAAQARKPVKRTRDRDAWLKKALDLLFAHGVAEVKIEVLARLGSGTNTHAGII